MAIRAPEAEFKRKFPRRKFARAIGFLFEGNYQLGVGVEIGEGGISLSLPTEFMSHRKAVLSFQIPDGSFVCVQVETRNCRYDPFSCLYVVGCLFVNIKFSHKREIRAYVSSKSELEF